jgi:hypothetical protein
MRRPVRKGRETSYRISAAAARWQRRLGTGDGAGNPAWCVQTTLGNAAHKNLSLIPLLGKFEKVRKDVPRTVQPKAAGASRPLSLRLLRRIARRPLSRFFRGNRQSDADYRDPGGSGGLERRRTSRCRAPALRRVSRPRISTTTPSTVLVRQRISFEMLFYELSYLHSIYAASHRAPGSVAPSPRESEESHDLLSSNRLLLLTCSDYAELRRQPALNTAHLLRL